MKSRPKHFKLLIRSLGIKEIARETPDRVDSVNYGRQIKGQRKKKWSLGGPNILPLLLRLWVLADL